MTFSSLSINRPVLAIVLSILIVLFGIYGFIFLGLREYPSVDPPIVTVTTYFVGANADVVETQITEPLESSINGISGIRTLTSVSSEGRSLITVEFELGVSMEAAANDVRDRVSRARANLPQTVDPPVVVKADADSDPILILEMKSNGRNLMELSEYCNNVYKERLQTIQGVSEIRIFGEQKYTMKLQLDPAKMSSYQITPSDVKNALNAENVELPTGRIEGYQTDLVIRTYGRLSTEDEFNNLIIKEKDGAVVRFSDIGFAKLLPENERTIFRGDELLPIIAIAIYPQPESNHIAIANEFYKRTAQLNNDLPKDIFVKQSFDSTIGIRKAISEVEETIVISFILVVLIIFLFLRHWRTTLIPVIAIPISLIGSFFIMYLAGFTINILTLLAIVLATGLVVDDAIVLLENIYRRIEEGENPLEAGHKGAKEIFFAIISTTVTLAAVFIPIIFISGLTGKLFREFAIVVAGSVVISAFVSLTLTPMLSAHTLRKTKHESKFFTVSERFFNSLTNFYNRSLISFIKRRYFALIIMIISFALVYVLGLLIPAELAPMEDKSRIRIQATAPEGTAYEVMDKYVLKLISIVDTMKEVETYISFTSPGFMNANSGFLRVNLVKPSQRKPTQNEIADKLNAMLRNYNFAKAFVIQEPMIGGRRSGLPIQYVILAPNFEKLKSVLPTLMDKISQSKMLQTVDVDVKFNKPELKIEIDRERAKILGVSVGDIAENLQLFYSGQRYGYFIKNEKQYYVIGQAYRENRDDPNDVQSLYIRNKQGKIFQMGNLISITNESNPPALYRFNRFVAATISAQPAPGYTLGQGLKEVQRIGNEVLPEDFATALAGNSRDFAESSGSLYFAFFFALILIYLILAAQFESFTDPLIIMFTVPLAIAGAYLSLYLTNQTVNIFSQIGIIVLVGIVTKNGILIVEFANKRKEGGFNKHDAVIEAATQRLRPILMTSLATLLGALPIALALGAASKSRSSLGIVIIGGLLFSLILTLYVIPALYTYMSKHSQKIPDSE